MTEEKEPGDVAESKAQTKTTSGDTTGVYPNATGITEIAMGVTEDICTFKVPLNYVLLGSYYDENNEEQSIQGIGFNYDYHGGSNVRRRIFYRKTFGMFLNGIT